jgi:hypothetical protein
METLINFYEGLFRLTDRDLIAFFVKAFGVVFSLLFVIYAVILSRQTATLNETLETRFRGFFSLISNVQLVVSIALLLLALFFI